MGSRVVNHCRLCGHEKTDLILNFGNQAYGCVYPGPCEEAPREPLVLVRCPSCGLVQLDCSVSPADLYAHGYGYQSGQTKTMRDHLAGLSVWASEIAGLGSGDLVIDIGCNDGTLLTAFPDDVRKLGFDPIAAQFPQRAGIEIIPELFEGGRAPSAKLITAIAMFYDLDDPAGFLSSLRDGLTDDGAIVIEVMYLGSMIDGAWDMVGHEHVTYWGITHLHQAAQSAGLHIVDAELVPINGQTLRVAMKKAAGDSSPLSVERLLRAEQRQNQDDQFWADWAGRVYESAVNIRSFVNAMSDDGAVIDILGASQKGNTVLQYCDLSPRTIRWAMERDDRKVGKRTPGTNIPIVHEDEARANPPEYFLVTPWQFKSEILQRESALIDHGCEFIFPLPYFSIEPRIPDRSARS